MHNYLNLPTPLEDMLAEARGYRLSLCLAHQHLGKLPREMREAIAANARTKLYFQLSRRRRPRPWSGGRARALRARPRAPTALHGGGAALPQRRDRPRLHAHHRRPAAAKPWSCAERQASSAANAACRAQRTERQLTERQRRSKQLARKDRASHRRTLAAAAAPPAASIGIASRCASQDRRADRQAKCPQTRTDPRRRRVPDKVGRANVDNEHSRGRLSVARLCAWRRT